MRKTWLIGLVLILMITVTGCGGGSGKSSNVPPDAQKEITAFSFTAAANSALGEDVTAVISGTDITVAVPHGTDVTALVATFTTTGETVKVGETVQTSGSTANDFTDPVIYTVVAKNSATQNYTVTVAVAPSAEERKEITAFSFGAANNPALAEDVTAVINGTDIRATVPHGTNVTALVATFTTTGETVKVGGTMQTSGSTANDFTHPVTYTVVAENNTTKDYMVTVEFAPYTPVKVEHSIVEGTETVISDTGDTGWRNHTGSSVASRFSYSFASDGDILDFYALRKQDQGAASAVFIQLWTPNASGLGSFLSNSTTNYISMRIKPSAPSGTQAYETAFALGNYGATRYAFNGELIRFRRNGTIVCNGTPGGTGVQQMELVSGTGQEVGTYQYNKWYTVTFEIDTSVSGTANVKAAIRDEESGMTYESIFSVATVGGSNPVSINSLRWMIYTGYSGATNDDLHIYVDDIKAYHFE
jgi:hypothetical protein